MTNLQNRKIFVTGGSRGIGAAVVQALAQGGAQVGFSYSSREESAQKVLASLPGQGHFCLRLDLSQEASIEEASSQIQEKFSDLYGLVNNAGITKDGLSLRMKTEDFQSVIDTNLKGTFILTRNLLRGMVKNRSGSIVNITSVIGQTGNPGQANYSASKAGLVGLSKSMALEVASRGVRINCVAPGFILTDMTEVLNEDQKRAILNRIPMERLASPGEVASSVLFLLSEDSKYITGHTLNINGGLFMN